MANAFSADLSKFLAHYSGNADATVRHAIVLVSQGVIMNTPVDTGRLRGNWQFGITPPSGTLAVEDKVGAGTMAKISAQTAGVRAGGECWIVNNLPYAARIEYGHSSVKAPHGMVRITLANLPAAIESYIKDMQ